jgi:hypothetical protein
MGIFENSYLFQKRFSEARKRGWNPTCFQEGVGRKINIIHMAMLYWPSAPPKAKRREVHPKDKEGNLQNQPPPPLDVKGRPHGEHLGGRERVSPI